MRVIGRMAWGLVVLFPCLGTQAAQRELSDAEADAIVAREARVAEEGKRARRAAMADNTVLSRKVTERGGRKVTMERIAPPPRVPVAATAADEVAAEAPAAPAKREVLVSVSATVYDDAVTELRWRGDGGARLAFSNADFSLLRGVTRLETADVAFSFLLGIGEGDRTTAAGGRGDLPPVPAAGSISDVAGSYLVVIPGGTDRDREVLAALDVLHLHYRQNERKLRVAEQRRQALAAARERYRKANPVEEKEAVIQFWRKDAGAAAGK